MRTHLHMSVCLAAATVCLWSQTLQAQVPVTSGLRLWLDAQDLDGDGVAEGLGESGLSGSAVTTWTDKAGTADNATQGNAAKQPTYLTSGFGAASLPLVRFDGVFGTGSGDSLDAGSGLNITGNGLTVFALVRQTTNSGPFNVEATILGNYTGGNGHLLSETAGDKWQFYADATGGNAGVAAGGDSTATLNRPVVLAGMHDLGTTYMYTNGIQVASAVNDPIASSAASFQIGYNVGTDPYHFKGDMAEILVYDRALTSLERDYVTAYFDGKYSLGIPEPSAVALLGVGAILLMRRRPVNRGA